MSNFKGSILSKVTTLQGRFPSRDPWKRCRSVFKVEVGRPFKGVDVLFFKDVDFSRVSILSRVSKGVDSECRSFQGCRFFERGRALQECRSCQVSRFFEPFQVCWLTFKVIDTFEGSATSKGFPVDPLKVSILSRCQFLSRESILCRSLQRI